MRLARAAAILGGGVPLRPAAALAEIDPDEAAEAVDALVAAGVLRRRSRRAPASARVRAPAGARRRLRRARPGRALARPRARRAAARPGGRVARARRRAAAALPAGRRPVGVRAARRRRAAGVRPRRRGRRHDLSAARARRAAAAAQPRRRPARPRRGRVPQHRSPAWRSATCARRWPASSTRASASARRCCSPGCSARPARSPTRSTCSRSTSRRSPTARTCARPAEAALVNVTRIDPATRPRAARVVERLRRRVDAGEEPDRAVLGTIAAEMGMAGEPAGPMAEVAERALDGFDLTIGSAAGWSGYNAVRSLVVAERYDTALRALDRALAVARQRGAVLDVGARAHVPRRAVPADRRPPRRRGRRAQPERDRRRLRLADGRTASRRPGSARCWSSAASWTRPRRCCRGAPADALPPVYPLIWGLLARGRLRLAQGRFEEAAEDLRESARRALGIGHRTPALDAVALAAGRGAARARRARRGAAAGRRGARAGARRSAPRARSASRCARMARVGGRRRRACCARRSPCWTAPRRSSSAPARTPTSAPRCARAGEADEARERLRLAVDIAHRCGADALEDAALGELRAAGARPRRRATTGAGALTPSERRIAELAASGARTARSRRRCSSPPRRWSSTCATRTASSGSAAARA